MAEDINWLEVKVTCDGETAEVVSEVLSRFITDGVVTETDAKYDEAEEVLIETGDIRVFGYLPYDDKTDEICKKIEEALWHLNMIRPIPNPTYKIILDQNWMESWKKYYNPIKIGEKLLILPSWLDQPEEDRNRVIVKIDPSMAFGTGTHPTTQMCMSLTEELCQPGMDVIDVGCGSGILSVTAIKLGAKKALGVDLDYASVVAAKNTAELNSVHEKLEVGLGSVTEINNGDFSFQNADFVLTNILAPIILRLFTNGLSKLVKENGYLILSGILDYQSDEVVHKALEEGLNLIKKEMINDWVALAFQK
ncbi:MAG: 50S ribosomal protein L11 methyltransferase [Anaerolineaceae bacterium]|nr:50S ribosomal protein L11 methyltransferase [Anaerolineaceae bacterium]